jgi:polyisoprenoid-binding protein YceI
MKLLQLAVAVLLVAVLGGSPLSAGARTWQIDPAHTNFYFTVDHIYSKVRGHFNTYSGAINFDPQRLGESSFSFKIATDSIDTNLAKRDKHLQSADFFDAGSFPEMTFASTKVVDAGQGRYDVHGTFTVKGVAYDLVLPLTFAGVKEHPAMKGKEVAGFNGTLVLDRLAYKIGDGKLYKLGVVGKDVEVLVTIEALADK